MRYRDGLLGEQGRAEMGISPGLVRLSVGIEDIRDLIADFAQALGRSAHEEATSEPLPMS